jgi:hypothetical protein
MSSTQHAISRDSVIMFSLKLDTTCKWWIWPLRDLHLPLQMHVEKTPLQIHFIYLGNKEIYCNFKTWCIISALFSTECCLFHNFISSCSNDTFCVKNVQKFKYQPSRLMVKSIQNRILPVWHSWHNVSRSMVDGKKLCNCNCNCQGCHQCLQFHSVSTVHVYMYVYIHAHNTHTHRQSSFQDLRLGIQIQRLLCCPGTWK